MFKKLIDEARHVVEASAMQAAGIKLAKAHSEKSFMNYEKKKTNPRNNQASKDAGKLFNKAQRRLGKAMVREPEESK